MDMVFSLLASAIAMTLIVGVRYLLTSGGFAWATRRKHPGLYAGLEAQMQREVRWSLLSAGIYGVPAGVVAWGWQNRGWTLIYADISAYPLWWYPVSIVACLLLHDSWFYWTHRLLHRPWWFKAAHAVHHDSRPPTAWTAMSFHPWEAVTGAVVVPLLVFVIPLHISALGLILAIMTLMGITNHMGWEMFPRFMVNGWLGNWLITATHHQHHHDAYRGNYGLYFRLWDKACGTDLGLGRFRHVERGGEQP
jgi:Delta7-sterol 5-desaturase